MVREQKNGLYYDPKVMIAKHNRAAVRAHEVAGTDHRIDVIYQS